ncbi:OmcA/MtrC family decaheme c-type cytochrome [Arhodomonas sp. AD133]|uniref:OmcA/MtrC family decaheme c-type cytochrome n=1 Tax=Arhodomonas sp. AD133 TaxID=3415009 RepID=UPI003EB9CAB3
MAEGQPMTTSKRLWPDAMTAAALGALLLLGLSGCGGDDGEQGPRGEPGPVGPPGPPSQAPAALNANITDVTIDSAPVVDFTVTDEHGFPFTGLEPGDPRFTIAKLVPGTGGDTDRWQSYINRLESPDGVGPGTEDKVQATTDGGGRLVNHGDGTYTYTFGTNIADVTDPVTGKAIPFEPDLTHRVGMELRGEFLGEELPAVSPTFTFQPSTGMTQGINDREIVALDSCNSCHGKLALHGGARVNTELCVTCHNPGSADANSGNTVDFRVMIHKIHMGEELPSVVAGGTYTIWGFGDTPHDYSDVAFPQDVRNCTTCHDPADPATPQASNITTNPTRDACGACHDDVNFAEGQAGGHPGGVVTDDSECTVCHAPNKIAGSVLESHTIGTKVAANRFEYNILGVTATAPGQTPRITFAVTDPTNDDAPYDVLNDPEFTAGGASRLTIDMAWDTADYTNAGDDAAAGGGGAPARPVSVNALDPANVTDNGDGSFTATSTAAIPATVTGSGAVAIEGHPAADLDGDGTFDDAVPVTGAVQFFAITDASPVARREVVDLAKCQTCHGENDGLSLHGANRTDNVQLCAMCHNPNNTDLAARPADPDGSVNGRNTNSADTLEERSIDFKTMIHAIHAADERTEDLIVYGFGNTPHNFGEVRFPRSPGDCLACHNDGTFELPVGDNVLGTTLATQATVNTASPFGTSDFLPSLAAAQEPGDDLNATPTAAVCSACHDSDFAKRHIEINGGAFDVTQTSIDAGAPIESCAVCHGPGRIADVRDVHGVE